MGLVYLPTWMVHFYGKCIGKYTSLMDPLGFENLVGCSSRLPYKSNTFFSNIPNTTHGTVIFTCNCNCFFGFNVSTYIVRPMDGMAMVPWNCQ